MVARVERAEISLGKSKIVSYIVLIELVEEIIFSEGPNALADMKL